MGRALVVGSFTPSVLLDLARRTGRLETHGVEVSEVPVTSSPSQFRSLLAGDHDAALTSPDNVIAYRFSPANPLGGTADVRIVAALDRGLGLGLYARPGMRAASLRGATVGVDVPSSGFALALYALAESLGVPRDRYEVATLGSTPRRLEALLDGRCDATMLNAGNELVAEQRGCPLLASTPAVCGPYLGTVLAIAGDRSAPEVDRLATALHETVTEVLARRLDDEVRAAASRLLALDPALADRYLARLLSPADGLVADARVDRPALETLVRLRRTYLPEVVDGVDVIETALSPDSGLVHTSGPR